MQFSIPYQITNIPNSSGVKSFALNNKRKFLACLTEKSIQLYDNSVFYPVLITSLTQFFDSIDIKELNCWLKWITDDDLAFVTQEGHVYISHILISERNQLIHDYDNDPSKKFLNKYEIIKILAPIQVSLFDHTESDKFVTSVFSANGYLGVFTSDSNLFYITKDAEIKNKMALFTKQVKFTNAEFYPPCTLFCLVDGVPHFINADIPTIENQKKPIIDDLPIKNATLTAINAQQTYLAVYKKKNASLRIYQLGLANWVPPITVYSSKNVDCITKNQLNEENSLEDPVIHICWDSKGNSLTIIHRSGKTCLFFVESKTLHCCQIDYFPLKSTEDSKIQNKVNTKNENTEDSKSQNKEDSKSENTEDSKSQNKEESKSENTEESKGQNKEDSKSENAEKMPEDTGDSTSDGQRFDFLFDSFGDRLFVNNGISVYFISYLQNNNFYVYTSVMVIDVRRNKILMNSTSLYPIKKIDYNALSGRLLIANDKSFQIIDNEEGMPLTGIISVVSEMNPKNRRLLDAHFIGENHVCAVVGTSDPLSDDHFELNFLKDRPEDSNVDCDNSFYEQFDSCYAYEELAKKEEAKIDQKVEKIRIENEGPIKNLILLLSYETPPEGSECQFKYEVKPDLLIKSSIYLTKFDFINNRGIFSDKQYVVFIGLMKNLDYPSRINTYYLCKSKKIACIFVNKLSSEHTIKTIAMSSNSQGRILLDDGVILDEHLKSFGNDLFNGGNNMRVPVDDLLATKYPPIVFFCTSNRVIEGRKYKYAFYKPVPTFVCFDHLLRYEEVPFAFDGSIFYLVPTKLNFASFSYRFVYIGQHIFIESINNYYETTFLLNFVYRIFNSVPFIVCETCKEACEMGILNQFLLFLVPHLKLSEVSQIIQYACSKSPIFSTIFDAFFDYISYSNKHFNNENKKYATVTINFRKFSSEIIKLEWNKIFSLMDINTRNQIFLKISTKTFPKLVIELFDEFTEMNANSQSPLEISNNPILNIELVNFLIENGEIIRPFIISSKYQTNNFCECFKSVFLGKNPNAQKFVDALNLIEKEKKQWDSNENVFPVVFHLLGCLFQVENLSLFSAATFIAIGQLQKFNAVLISDEGLKENIEQYLDENPDGMYAKEIKDSLASI